MDSREIALAVKEKERRERMKEQKKKEEALEKRRTRESTDNRVILTSSEDGDTMTVKPRPLYRFFTSFDTDSFWFICVTAVAFPIVFTVFGVSYLGKYIDNLYLNVLICVAFCLFVIFIFFIGFRMLKYPKLHLKITKQDYFGLSTFNKDKPIAVGKKEDIRISVSDPDAASGWGEFSITAGGKTYSYKEIKPKDIGRVREYIRRNKLEGY